MRELQRRTWLEVFDHGAYDLPRALAAKLLEAHTGTHRTNCYKALRLNGRLPGISAPRVKPFPVIYLTSEIESASLRLLRKSPTPLPNCPYVRVRCCLDIYMRARLGIGRSLSVEIGAHEVSGEIWEIIADNLRSRLELGWASAIDSNGLTIWMADAHRDNGKRLVVHADEKLTAFFGTTISDSLLWIVLTSRRVFPKLCRR